MKEKVVITSIKTGMPTKGIKKDETGYYYMPLGALNVFNSAGEFYTTKDVLSLFESDSSPLMRKIKSGQLRGEVGHPKLTVGMTKEQYISRNMRIHEDNVCHHIKSIELIPTNDNPGLPGEGNTLLIYGWVKPAGPKGSFLQEALDNEDENVAFSIRSFTANHFDRHSNALIKKIVEVVTWDYVNEPGISYATKWKSLGIESRDCMVFDLDTIATDTGEIDACFECSLESADEKLLVQDLIHKVRQEFKKESIIKRW